MDLPLPWFLASVAVRTLIVLAALVVGIRTLGKRSIGELNLIDLVMVLLIGNAVQNALTYGSGHLGVGLVSAATLLAADWFLGDLFGRHPEIERLLLGEPVILGTHGQLDRVALRRNSITEDEVLSAMHDQGLADLGQVRLVILEEDGDISIIPEEHKS